MLMEDYRYEDYAYENFWNVKKATSSSFCKHIIHAIVNNLLKNVVNCL